MLTIQSNIEFPFRYQKNHVQGRKHYDSSDKKCHHCCEIILPSSYLDGWHFCPVNNLMVWYYYDWYNNKSYKETAIYIINNHKENYETIIKERTKTLYKRVQQLLDWQNANI